MQTKEVTEKEVLAVDESNTSNGPEQVEVETEKENKQSVELEEAGKCIFHLNKWWNNTVLKLFKRLNVYATQGTSTQA